MEPLAALGLAGNVMQMISFVHETWTTYSHLKDKGTSNPNLKENTEKLNALVRKLEGSLNQTAGKAVTPDQKQLKSLATKCLEAGNTLEAQLKKLAVDPKKSSRPERIGKLIKTMWRHDKIERLERDVKRCSQTLGMGLLVRIW